jgi:SAM-dependent methyltransferase
MNSSAQPTPERLMQFAWGYAPVFIIDAALEVGLFACLAQGPRTPAQLAAETGASLRGLTALANALVGLQLLAREGDAFSLTPESAAYLVPSSPDYRGAFFRHHTAQLLPQWTQLGNVVRTGQPALRTDHGEHGANYFAGFVESLFPVNQPAAARLGEHLGLAQASAPVKVLDLGAGSGVWGITLAGQSAQVHITAVDWPEVLEVTRRVAARHGVAARLTTVPGDLYTVDFGGGFQLATLGHILHSDGPERVRSLLRKTFAALAPGGTIVIQEFMPDDDRRGPSMPLIFGVNMLVNTEAGGTYTFAELAAWLREAGFADPRRLDFPGSAPLALATRAT